MSPIIMYQMLTFMCIILYAQSGESAHWENEKNRIDLEPFNLEGQKYASSQRQAKDAATAKLEKSKLDLQRDLISTCFEIFNLNASDILSFPEEIIMNVIIPHHVPRERQSEFSKYLVKYLEARAMQQENPRFLPEREEGPNLEEAEEQRKEQRGAGARMLISIFPWLTLEQGKVVMHMFSGNCDVAVDYIMTTDPDSIFSAITAFKMSNPEEYGEGCEDPVVDDSAPEGTANTGLSQSKNGVQHQQIMKLCDVLHLDPEIKEMILSLPARLVREQVIPTCVDLPFQGEMLRYFEEYQKERAQEDPGADAASGTEHVGYVDNLIQKLDSPANARNRKQINEEDNEDDSDQDSGEEVIVNGKWPTDEAEEDVET